MIKFNPLELSDHDYYRTYNGTKYTYSIPNLIQFAKEKKYKPFTLDLRGVDMSCLMWSINNMRDIAYHFDRVMKSDISIPILIDDRGIICDGWHRFIKAVILKKDTIKAIRLEEMPYANSEEKVN